MNALAQVKGEALAVDRRGVGVETAVFEGIPTVRLEQEKVPFVRVDRGQAAVLACDACEQTVAAQHELVVILVMASDRFAVIGSARSEPTAA